MKTRHLSVTALVAAALLGGAFLVPAAEKEKESEKTTPATKQKAEKQEAEEKEKRKAREKKKPEVGEKEKKPKLSEPAPPPRKEGRPEAAPPPGPAGEFGPFLQLRPEQREKFREALAAHRERMLDLGRRIQELNREATRLALSGEADPDKLHRIGRELAELETERTLSRIKLLSKLGPSLTPEQRERLQDRLADWQAARPFGPPWAAGRPGPGPRGPGWGRWFGPPPGGPGGRWQQPPPPPGRPQEPADRPQLRRPQLREGDVPPPPALRREAPRPELRREGPPPGDRPEGRREGQPSALRREGDRKAPPAELRDREPERDRARRLREPDEDDDQPERADKPKRREKESDREEGKDR